MIFHDKQVLHFHAGKTAGSSVEKWLCPNVPISAIDASQYWQDNYLYGWSNKHYCFLQHLTTEHILKLELINQRVFDSYYKFTIVRNPIDRLFSIYCYNKRFFEKYKTFDRFCAHLPAEFARRNPRSDHLNTQAEYVFLCGEKVVDVYLFEELPKNLSPVMNRLEMTTPFPHINPRRMTLPFDLSRYGLSNILRVYGRDFESFYPTLDVGDFLH